MTRFYTNLNIPEDKIAGFDENFDGKSGLGDGQGAVYKKDGKLVVDFESPAFDAFKNAFVTKINSIVDKEKFAANPLGKSYMALFNAIASDPKPVEPEQTQPVEQPLAPAKEPEPKAADGTSRFYAELNLPEAQAAGFDANFDGGTGTADGQGAVYKKDGKLVVDFAAPGYAAFKETFSKKIESIGDKKKFESSPLGKVYMDLYREITSNRPQNTAPSKVATYEPNFISLTLLGDDPITSHNILAKEWVEAAYACFKNSGDADFQDLSLYYQMAAIAKESPDNSIDRTSLEMLRVSHPAQIDKLFAHFQNETYYSMHTVNLSGEPRIATIFIDKITEIVTIRFESPTDGAQEYYNTSQGILVETDYENLPLSASDNAGIALRPVIAAIRADNPDAATILESQLL